MVFTENTAKMDVAYQKIICIWPQSKRTQKLKKNDQTDGCGFIFGRGFWKDGMTIVTECLLELFYIRIYQT